MRIARSRQSAWRSRAGATAVRTLRRAKMCDIEMTGRGHRAVHDRGRRVVAAHRVYGDVVIMCDCRDLLLRRRLGPAAAVVAAMRAYAVRRLRLVALRAQARGRRVQRVVRAALGRPRLRMSAFWIRHGLSVLPSIGFRAPPAADPPRPARSRTCPVFRFVPHCGTEPPAVLPAQRLHRQRQVELLAHQLVQSI